MEDLGFEPTVLKWAREKSISLAPEALETVLSKGWREVSRDIVEGWEAGTAKPTFEDIKKLAGIYRRPVAVFFLDSPPAEASKPPDKRTIGSKDNKIFSPKGFLIIRKARRVQRIARELLEDLGQRPSFKYGKYSLTNNPEKLAESVREDFGISAGEQAKAKTYAEFFERVRVAVENTGVITLRTGPGERLPKADARAFSFADSLPYLILVNTSDTEGAKNFSLLHEFAHILLRDAAICNNFKSFNNRSDKIEVFCNRFAASFLVPEQDFLAHRLLVGRKNIDTKEIESIASQLAVEFKVSRFVILRRLLTYNFIGRLAYDEKAERWSDETPPKKGGGSFSVRQFLSKNGVRYSNLVINAYKQQKISRSRVSDYLGFKSKHLKSFERLLGQT